MQQMISTDNLVMCEESTWAYLNPARFSRVKLSKQIWIEGETQI